MKYIIEDITIPGVKIEHPNERVLKILLSPELKSTDKFTLLSVQFSPGNGTGLHAHNSEEVMYVVAGRGEGVVGEEKKEIREGTVIFAPKHFEHCIKNNGEEPLKLICFFIPPFKPSSGDYSYNMADYFDKAVDKAKEFFKKI